MGAQAERPHNSLDKRTNGTSDASFPGKPVTRLAADPLPGGGEVAAPVNSPLQDHKYQDRYREENPPMKI